MYYVKDEYKKRIDLYFDDIPQENVREFLKADGWKWNKDKKCWFTFLSRSHIETAEALGACLQTTERKSACEMPVSALKSRKEERPMLNKIYIQPETVSGFRNTPATTDELIEEGLSPDVVFLYLRQMYNLYTAVITGSKTDSLELHGLVEFCKKNGIIRDFTEIKIKYFRIMADQKISFTKFRFVMEMYLTNTDQTVQYLKMAYGIDVTGYEWWRKDWSFENCRFGRFSITGAQFTPLNNYETIAMLNRLQNDESKGLYPKTLFGIFNPEFIKALVLANIEPTTEDKEEPEDRTIYVHKGRICCQTQKHPVIQATAIFENHCGYPIELNVNYCKLCKKFFMSYLVYKHYRSKYGTILGDLRILKGEKFEDYENWIAEESPLHLCGYNVEANNGLTSTERQRIIAYVIDNGIMAKSEVISHLTWLIERNRSRDRMENAVAKWNCDLTYTLEYNKESQERYIVDLLKKYYPNQFRMP